MTCRLMLTYKFDKKYMLLLDSFWASQPINNEALEEYLVSYSYHKPWHFNFTNKITMPGCRCTNKKSWLVKNSSTSKWKHFTYTQDYFLQHKSLKSFFMCITWEHGSQFCPAPYCYWPSTITLPLPNEHLRQAAIGQLSEAFIRTLDE